MHVWNVRVSKCTASQPWNHGIIYTAMYNFYIYCTCIPCTNCEAFFWYYTLYAMHLIYYRIYQDMFTWIYISRLWFFDFIFFSFYCKLIWIRKQVYFTGISKPITDWRITRAFFFIFLHFFFVRYRWLGLNEDKLREEFLSYTHSALFWNCTKI